MKVFFIGSSGPLSTLPLEWLLGSSHELCGIGTSQGVLAGQAEGSMPAVIGVNSNPLAAIANEYGIPLLDLRLERLQLLVEQIAALQPDLLLVSCYAGKLPDELLQQATYGGINCHPSLLPAYRGPVPIFWQYRDGVDPLGVSLHCINQQWDAGDVIASSKVVVTNGQSAAQVEQELAAAFSRLLDETLDVFPDGITRHVQNSAHASYFGYPEGDDFAIDTNWTARRAFNFMRATEHWGRAYPVMANGRAYALKHALAWANSEDGVGLMEKQGVVRIKLNPGVLAASYYH